MRCWRRNPTTSHHLPRSPRSPSPALSREDCDRLLRDALARLNADIAPAQFPPDDPTVLWATDELTQVARSMEGAEGHEAEYAFTQALEAARERLQLRFVALSAAHRATGWPVSGLH